MILAEAKLNHTLNLVHTWLLVYTLLDFDLSHVVCFMSSLCNANAPIDSLSTRIVIPFPVSIVTKLFPVLAHSVGVH